MLRKHNSLKTLPRGQAHKRPKWYLGWIPGLGTDIFFLNERLILKKIEIDSMNCADSGVNQFLVRFPRTSILEFSANFWKCVGGAYLTEILSIIFPTSWAGKTYRFLWFKVNPRNFNPCKIDFRVVIYCIAFFHVDSRPRDKYQKMWYFPAHLLIYVKSLSQDVHLPKRLRISSKVDFRCSVPKISVQGRYHFNDFHFVLKS